jgi:hypothetical protein
MFNVKSSVLLTALVGLFFALPAMSYNFVFNVNTHSVVSWIRLSPVKAVYFGNATGSFQNQQIQIQIMQNSNSLMHVADVTIAPSVNSRHVCLINIDIAASDSGPMARVYSDTANCSTGIVYKNVHRIPCQGNYPPFSACYAIDFFYSKK